MIVMSEQDKANTASDNRTPDERLLLRLVLAWDSDDIEFMAALAAARKRLGLKLADSQEAREEEEVLLANGFTADGRVREEP